MSNITRPDLLEQHTKDLVAMNADRRAVEMNRVMAGRAKYSIIECLGYGRCMFPTDGDRDGKRLCPFCMFYDDARTHTDAHAHRTAELFVKGH